MKTIKQYKTEKQLEKLLDLETSRLMSHQTQEEYEQSKLNLITYSQDYYVVTGDWFHKTMHSREVRSYED